MPCVRGFFTWRRGISRCWAVRCWRGSQKSSARLAKTETYLDLEEVLWWAIDLFEALLARVWHCLHGCGFLEARACVLSVIGVLVLGMKVRSFNCDFGGLSEGRVIDQVSEHRKSLLCTFLLRRWGQSRACWPAQVPHATIISSFALH
jgi:hypothetical protein